MSIKDDDNDEIYFVVVNDEEQYALWPSHSSVPPGWTVKFGPDQKAPCLNFVNENWTDMRPRSLREADKARLN